MKALPYLPIPSSPFSFNFNIPNTQTIYIGNIPPGKYVVSFSGPNQWCSGYSTCTTTDEPHVVQLARTSSLPALLCANHDSRECALRTWKQELVKHAMEYRFLYDGISKSYNKANRRATPGKHITWAEAKTANLLRKISGIRIKDTKMLKVFKLKVLVGQNVRAEEPERPSLGELNKWDEGTILEACYGEDYDGTEDSDEEENEEDDADNDDEDDDGGEDDDSEEKDGEN